MSSSRWWWKWCHVRKEDSSRCRLKSYTKAGPHQQCGCNSFWFFCSCRIKSGSYSSSDTWGCECTVVCAIWVCLSTGSPAPRGARSQRGSTHLHTPVTSARRILRTDFSDHGCTTCTIVKCFNAVSTSLNGSVCVFCYVAFSAMNRSWTHNG